MNTNNQRARTWRVRTPDGQSAEITGAKIIVSDSGALMLLGTDGQPARIWQAWLDCEAINAGD